MNERLQAALPAAPPEPELPGPFPVGEWATGFREFLRDRPRVRLQGEVLNFGRARNGHAYFELRDAGGAVSCAMWANDLDAMGLPEEALRDGCEVVVAGGPEYYPGGPSAGPRFSFRAGYLRLAGEGDLLARLQALRRRLGAEGLFKPQKLLPRPLLPRTIGVVTGETGKARSDLLAGFERRGWRGTIVWGFAPVQDRHAAPRIAEAISDLAALPQVEVIVVCRGGGGLTDLWAFCDEALCRRVALLAKPVISAVGHHTDRTLIDDVAAIACSTPTHAAEAAVRLDSGRARSELTAIAAGLQRSGRGAVSIRARRLAAAARTPAAQLRGQRTQLHQQLREIRAAMTRSLRDRRERDCRVPALVLSRKAASRGGLLRRRQALERTAVALRAHDPRRTLERGYALVADAEGRPVTTAAAARKADRVGIEFADGNVRAIPVTEEPPKGRSKDLE